MKHAILICMAVLILITVNTTVPAAMVQNNNNIPQDPDKTAIITCYFPGTTKTTTVTPQEAQHLLDLFTRLANATANNPDSPETQDIQQQILTTTEALNLLPNGMTVDKAQTQLQQYRDHLAAMPRSPLILPERDHEFLCSFVTTGTVGLFPIIILPRLIPIIQLPIPRVIVAWSTQVGVSSVGGLISRTGFIADGQQRGFALGFWGIGLSIFLPPVSCYALFGYAAFTQVFARNIAEWNPNNPPDVAPDYPLDNAVQVPVNTTELRFSIVDMDNDRMSYSVTTSPDIGGGNGNNLKDGTYSVPISNLEKATHYTWTVQVTDGKDTTVQTYSFTTET
jgi:hypothetical protein